MTFTVSSRRSPPTTRSSTRKHASYFDTRKKTFEGTTLVPYNELISDIEKTYPGTPIGASESVVSPLSDDLGLKMLTPVSFLEVLNDGTDPAARDKRVIDQQIEKKQIKVYVYDSQNSTPDVQAQVEKATAGHPGRDRDRDPHPGRGLLPGLADTAVRDLKQALAEATGER